MVCAVVMHRKLIGKRSGAARRHEDTVGAQAVEHEHTFVHRMRTHQRFTVARHGSHTCVLGPKIPGPNDPAGQLAGHRGHTF